MSEQPETYSRDIDDHAYAPEEAALAAADLDEPQSTPDVPWTPPEQRPLGAQFADVEAERAETGGETIEQRIAQEQPEEGTAYGAPEPVVDPLEDPEDELVGGVDPDAIPAETDVEDPRI